MATLEQRLLKGEFIAVGEYRHSKAEPIEWRDKQTARQMKAVVLRHSVEFGDLTVAITERVPEGVKAEDVHPPFTKGDTVILHIEELTKAKGLVSARGSLEKFKNPSSTATGSAVGDTQKTR